MTLSYKPFDREEKLGSPPWRTEDPKVMAWEEAHGHDVRLKCYPEYGCQVLEVARQRVEDAAKRFVLQVEELPIGMTIHQTLALDELRQSLKELNE